MKGSFVILCVAGMMAVLSAASGATGSSGSSPVQRPECDENSPLCAEVYHSVGYGGGYTGHDEPALLFYSNAAGSGSSMTYQMTIPTEPPTPPTQDGTGGTNNFQLHPAFWLGMALCNDESSPNPGGSYVGPQVPCAPNSDSNIYNSPDPSSPQYIGRHPGTAFLELQFYPPGWAPFQAGGISCDATKWCVAMVIWSLATNDNTGQELNSTCQKVVGLEYPNFAFLTHSGTSQAPANPVEATGATFTPDSSRDLFMSGGDELTVSIHDTAHGLFTGVSDVTRGESGSMTASAANGFGEVQFIPTGLGLLWSVWYYARNRQSWAWRRHGLALLVVSLLTTPYSWMTDEVVLLPAILQGVVWLNRAKLKVRSQLVVLLFVCLDLLLLLIIRAQVPAATGIFFWSSLVWFSWYWYARSFAQYEDDHSVIFLRTGDATRKELPPQKGN